MSPLLKNSPSNDLGSIVSGLVAGCATEAERAVRIHDFVRDLPFGFTPFFDSATPAQTLRFGGHCNPKGTLMVEILQRAGMEAHLHAVNIDNRVLHGCLASAPPVLTHTYTEVRVDGQWRSLDSYIVDRELFGRAKARLQAEGRRLGYGIHVAGTCEWDGRCDAFSQFAAPGEMLVEDLGRLEGEGVKAGAAAEGRERNSNSGANSCGSGGSTGGVTSGDASDGVSSVAAMRGLERHPRFANRVGLLPLAAALAPLRLAPGWATRALSSRVLAVRRGEAS